MKLIITFLALIIPLQAFTQMTVEYFDENWNPTTREAAGFYREIIYDKEGKPIGIVRDYWVTGELQFEGELSSVNPDALKGVCTWYYRNGQKWKEERYENGKLIGKVREWTINGKEESVLDDSGYFFSKGQLSTNIKFLESVLKKHIVFDTASIIELLLLGKHFMKLNDYEKGLFITKIAHDVSKNYKNVSTITVAFINIGEYNINQGNYSEAILWNEKALALYNNFNLGKEGKEIASTIYNNIGGAYMYQGNYLKAIDNLLKSLNILNNTERIELQVKTFNNLGECNRLSGKFEDALEWYNKALSASNQYNIEDELGIISSNIGLLYLNQGNFSMARNWLNKAIPLVNSKKTLALVYNNIGESYRLQAISNEAINWYKKAVDIAKEYSIEYILPTVFNNIGLAHSSNGHFSKALIWYSKAQEIFERLEMEVPLAKVYQNIASVYRTLNKYPLSLIWYNKALGIQNRLGLEVDISTTLNNIGILYLSQDSLSIAIDWFRKAIRIEEKIGLKIQLASSYNYLGVVYFEKEEYDSSIVWHQKAIKVSQEINLSYLQAISYIHLGRTSLRLEKFDDALKYLKKAKSIFHKLELDYFKSINANDLAFTFLNKSELDSALFYSNKYMELSKNLQKTNLSHSDKIIYKNLDAIEIGMLSSLLLSQFETAFNFSEELKASTLIDLLIEKTTLRQDISKSSKNSIYQLDNKVIKIPIELENDFSLVKNGLNIVHQALAKDMPQLTRQSLIHHRDSLYQRREILEDRIRLLAPEYAEIAYPKPVQVQEVQRILKQDEAVVSYYLGSLEALAFIITKDDFQTISLGATEIINKTVQHLRDSVFILQKKYLKEDNYREQAKIKFTFHRLSKAVYDLVWAGVDSTNLVSGKKILLTPDGILHYLPFELLISDDTMSHDYSTYNYLINEHAINYYPSATVLEHLRTKTKKEQAPKSFFGVGVSNFKGNYCYDDFVELDQLTKNRQFFKTIEGCYEKEDYQILLNEEATKNDFKQIPLKEFRNIHFATHGLINEENPAFSRILLQQSDSSLEGCLHLYEFFELDLNADLVTFGACGTALGKLVKGEGMMGFTRALMYAGTPSIILSLWEVAETPTEALFSNYYCNLSDSPDKHQPLRAIQKAMIQSEEYNNPFYWAPFIFIGEREITP